MALPLILVSQKNNPYYLPSTKPCDTIHKVFSCVYLIIFIFGYTYKIINHDKQSRN